MKRSIAFIIPWFGRWPRWMRFTVQSMGANANIDFLFFTDQDLPANCPANIKISKYSWTRYKERVSEKLQIAFTPENAYKLCDLKPALGHVHEEELKPYDFWGFCDIDLIFGQIRQTLNDSILQRYDVFTSYDRRIAGHFTLMKNDNHRRFLYRQCNDWKKTFEDANNHYAFDEKSFSDLFFKFKNYPLWLRRPMQWICKPHSRKLLAKNTFNTPHGRYPWVDGKYNFPEEWTWQNGILHNNLCPQPWLYFHFFYWKNIWEKLERIDVFEENKPLPKKWKVTAKGFSRC